MQLLDDTAEAGGRMFAQVHSRGLNVVMSFKTQLPFDDLPAWKPFRALPLDEQRVRLRDPETRRRLIEGADDEPVRRALGTEARPFPYEWIFLFDSVAGPHPSIASIARERGVAPAEAMIDLALERDFDRFFIHPVANEKQDAVLEMMRHPRAVVTFSDSGAHVSQISDASLQTHLLSHWVRDKQAFELEQAVRMLTLVPATQFGIADRGLVREGFAADLVVFDPDTIAPEMPQIVHDLPAGARRLVQHARGIAATVVNGEVLLRDGKPTGTLPGRLLRNGRAR
jgi:N-acyl-D-aspartate/D-glutamate deacylase